MSDKNRLMSDKLGDVLFGPLFRVAYLPINAVAGRHWMLRLAGLVVGLVWFAVFLVVVLFPFSVFSIGVGLWETTNGKDSD